MRWACSARLRTSSASATSASPSALLQPGGGRLLGLERRGRDDRGAAGGDRRGLGLRRGRLRLLAAEPAALRRAQRGDDQDVLGRLAGVAADDVAAVVGPERPRDLELDEAEHARGHGRRLSSRHAPARPPQPTSRRPTPSSSRASRPTGAFGVPGWEPPAEPMSRAWSERLARRLGRRVRGRRRQVVGFGAFEQALEGMASRGPSSRAWPTSGRSSSCRDALGRGRRARAPRCRHRSRRPAPGVRGGPAVHAGAAGARAALLRPRGLDRGHRAVPGRGARPRHGRAAPPGLRTALLAGVRVGRLLRRLDGDRVLRGLGPDRRVLDLADAVDELDPLAGLEDRLGAALAEFAS